MRKKQVAIAVGGTGGHVLPAVTLSKSLETKEISSVFFGVGIGKNRFLTEDAHLRVDVYGGQLSLRPFFRFFWNACKTVYGIFQSLYLLKKNRISLVIGFGSYHSLPTLFAAKFLSIPIVLVEANVFPGKVNRLFSRFALWTAAEFVSCEKYLRSEVKSAHFLTKRLQEKMPSVEESRRYFGLQTDVMTVLIFGGSQGANSLQMLTELLSLKTCQLQVIHFIGKYGSVSEQEAIYDSKGISHSVKVFEKNMQYAYRAANFAITRGGASTIAELIEYRLPALVVPYPFAADNHQLKNAQFFAHDVGGGIVLEEKEVPQRGEATLHTFFDENFLAKKKSLIARFLEKKSKTDLSDHILDLLELCK